VSLIYWVGNTKTDAELVLPKHSILSPKLDSCGIKKKEKKEKKRKEKKKKQVPSVV